MPFNTLGDNVPIMLSVIQVSDDYDVVLNHMLSIEVI